jgi:hypothetical protein
VDPAPEILAKSEKEAVKAASPAPSLTPAPVASVELPQAQSSGSTHEAKTSKVASRWKDQAIIGVKPVTSAQATSMPASQAKVPSNSSVWRALPGMAKTSSLPTPQKTMKSEEKKAESRSTDQVNTSNIVKSSSKAKEATPTEKPAIQPTQKLEKLKPQPAPTVVPETDKKQEKQSLTPPSPRTKHARIPSTGNRATVMDIAQALAQPGSAPTTDTTVLSISTDSEKPAPAPPSPTARTLSPPSANTERRKSSIEKYSAFAMPALKEEKSPAPSPAGSVRKSSFNEAARQDKPQDLKPPSQAVVAPAEKPSRAPSITTSKNINIRAHVHRSYLSASAPKEQPLPKVNVPALLADTLPKFQPNPDMRDISLDVMTINGSAASSIARDPNIFYDAEVLAVIHRAKSKSSGLVETKVWGWLGKQSQLGEKEEKKLNELAKRYNTPLVSANVYLREAILS